GVEQIRRADCPNRGNQPAWKNHLRMKTKTLSDYPLLIGEVIRRSEIRRQKKEQWKQFWHKTVRLTK
ncbi:MAG TPA: hypothetical protein VFO40_23550, partial [Chthoniobacterales bacterium]|nr:hypothetical protein [Chthoniobacterales bacterium]